jgi:hypothetical protein
MFLRLTPRTLFLLVLGFALPAFTWKALEPAARYGLGRLAATEARHCHYDQRTVAGALEMYQLDYNLEVEHIDAKLLGQLVELGYLREVPEHRRETWSRVDTYLIAPATRDGIVCRFHGEGDWRRPRPLSNGLAYVGRVGLPYAAGVLMTLLLQGLLGWRRRGAPMPEAEVLPEWFTDPVFKPASKAVIAELGPDASCPVCSQHLIGDTQSLLECLRCATPHHLDCAGYTERCGVYACGEGGDG